MIYYFMLQICTLVFNKHVHIVNGTAVFVKLQFIAKYILVKYYCG